MEFFENSAAVCFFVKITTEELTITVFVLNQLVMMTHFFYSKIIFFKSLS